MVAKLNIANTSLKRALPHPQLGINLWSQSARAKVVTQVVDEYGNVNDEVFFFNFDGVIQPLVTTIYSIDLIIGIYIRIMKIARYPF